MKYDIFFISYDESNSKQNWNRLLQFHDNSRLIANIKGIAEAHMICNTLSTTERFWTVDADNWLIQSLEIDWQYEEDLIFFNAEDSFFLHRASSINISRSSFFSRQNRMDWSFSPATSTSTR